jgi:hypothetical protein
LADHLVPPVCAEQPFVQPFAGVAEGSFAAQPLAGTETVERDGEELDSGE